MVIGKVSVENLHVAMVTGMSMKIHPSQSDADRPDIIRAKVKAHDRIFAQNQVSFKCKLIITKNTVI